ncbi:hypothetical protein OAL55_02225 [Verrucomicrobiales bacterium]|nr:hypothetical protein [Verrucomicrobiales bacterium]MDC0322159.1 hypothetical protein [Verrucomicrobiales bacterium]
MKPTPDFDTPFEESLAEFEMAPLPADWKADLIDNAVSESTKRNIISYSFFKKASITALAACWIAIGLLHFTMPREAVETSAGYAKTPELSPEELPLIVHYLASRGSFNSVF